MGNIKPLVINQNTTVSQVKQAQATRVRIDKLTETEVHLLSHLPETITEIEIRDQDCIDYLRHKLPSHITSFVINDQCSLVSLVPISKYIRRAIIEGNPNFPLEKIHHHIVEFEINYEIAQTLMRKLPQYTKLLVLKNENQILAEIVNPRLDNLKRKRAENETSNGLPVSKRQKIDEPKHQKVEPFPVKHHKDLFSGVENNSSYRNLSSKQKLDSSRLIDEKAISSSKPATEERNKTIYLATKMGFRKIEQAQFLLENEHEANEITSTLCF